MNRNRHRFRSVWWIEAPAEEVRSVLEDAGSYPQWWRQVREVCGVRPGAVPDDGVVGTARIRSVLPFDLHLTGRPARRDREAGLLRIALGGDLEGVASWTVRTPPDGKGTVVVFDQDVLVHKPLLRLLAVPGRPFLRANHALMMRSGRRGLRRRLRAGFGEP